MKEFFLYIYKKVKESSLAKILLLIIFLKFAMFYGFLKGYLYPTFLKPKYENEDHRSEEVIKKLLDNHNKTLKDDREH
ncbi:DUF4492 domain-containing protein [Natronoflexus pectinivorans]|uniref:Uncharacterized protein DUF4492 n=1 Tax=Natronoflexus pectinivorans TaxID=682526 RepID=A0A4R2GNE6_9BACT|nr:DUF4492 domain-containing protein [Natronoflexus pectinivorans]TCO10557.1 uncharacterized protein DUF4492 [Natronoflexus pectinivorans]